MRSPVACGALLLVTCGCPSYHASFRAGGLEYREYRMHTWAVGRRRGARGGGWFGGGLFIPWRACGGSLGVCVHGHTSCVCFMVFHGFPVFSCGALRLGGLFSLMLSHTLSHGVLVLCVRGMLAGVPSCWWWCGRCVLSLVRCAPRLPFVVWQRGASCNILVSAVGMFPWRLPYVFSSFCFTYWCWGAHKSPTPTACTLLSVLGHATFSFSVLAALSEVGKHDFTIYFCWLCLFFLVF